MANTRELAALKQGSAYLAYRTVRAISAYGVWRLSMERPGLVGLQEVEMARPPGR